MSFIMDLRKDWRILKSFIKPRGKVLNQAELMEKFYAQQAPLYDQFRKKLLHGREDLFKKIDWPAVNRWTDMGAGTGSNLELLPPQEDLEAIHLVDLSPSLLAVAQRRIKKLAMENVACFEGDATKFVSTPAPNLITFSYSLTMIPDWFKAIDNAWEQLPNGGLIGVVDFFVSRKRPDPGYQRHDYTTRTLWPLWFAYDNVFLNPDHLPYLKSKFSTVYVSEKKGKIPYLPSFAEVPYYIFVGKKL